MLDTIVNWILNALSWVVGLLPDSPFQNLLTVQPVQEYLGYIAYFIDIGFILDTTLAWLGAVTTYYIVSAILRWVKALG